MNGYSNIETKKLPKGWKLDFLDTVTIRGTGHTPDKKHPEYYNGSVKWVSLADSDKLDKVYIDSTAIEISDKGIENSSAVLHPAGTVILSRDAGVGKSAILKTPMAVSQHYITWQCKGEIDNHYLYYVLQYLKPEFERIAVGSTIKTIGMPYFRKLKILLPPLAEQKKIGQMLLNYDQVLFQLEKLSNEKLLLKKGLMQELLTGKKRLKGFKGKWKETTLGDILNYEQPGKYIVKSTEYNNLFDIAVLTANKTFILGYTDERDSVFTDVPVIIFDDFTTLSKYVDFPFKVKSSALKILKANSSSFNLRYVFEAIQLIEHSPGGHKRYWISEYQQIKIKHPPLNEQREIAIIGEIIENEIAALASQLEYYEQQKKGLMQQLLTGKKRVKAK